MVAPYDLARAGGVNTHLRAQARALGQLGHTVRIYGPASAPPDEGEVALSGSVVVTFGGTESGLGLDPRSRSRVAALFRTEPFDIVHVHEPLVPLLPWFALRYARSRVVATFHVHREQGHRWYPLGRPWLRSLINRIDVRLAVSDAARRTVAAHFPGDYEIVPNAIDVDAFRAPRSRPRLLNTLSTSSTPSAMDRDPLHVLYVGRLEPRKGVDHLIRAMAPMNNTQNVAPKARLIVVGDGPDRTALVSLARAVGTDVVFVGRVDDDALPAYLQASDIVCAPATGGESFGIVLLEAMACQKPIVASRIEGYEALVGPAGCGTLVPGGDAGALGAAIRSLLGDATLRRTLGARGLEAVRAYDWSIVARRLDAIYQELLTSRGSLLKV
ncbi:MAG TPA: glycosyltransferase family 4 protein [Vicinamibacterales bacterium]|nr:glycosyltransferase family 4 protein [Vicinamibacterales bacterium]